MSCCLAVTSKIQWYEMWMKHIFLLFLLLCNLYVSSVCILTVLSNLYASSVFSKISTNSADLVRLLCSVFFKFFIPLSAVCGRHQFFSGCLSGCLSIYCLSDTWHFAWPYLLLISGFEWNFPQIFIMWVGFAKEELSLLLLTALKFCSRLASRWNSWMIMMMMMMN